MSHTLDVLTDVEHGTVEGYRQGCRTSHCPANDFGLACIRANTLAAGNWQYLKAVQRGMTPREVAVHLGLTAPVAVAAVSKEEPVVKSEKVAVKPSQKEVRTWARSVGIDVPARGTLPRAVVEAFTARGKGVQASDVKPAPVEPAREPEPEVVEEAAPTGVEVASASVKIIPLGRKADWSLPLASDDLRSIADAIDALQAVPPNVVELDRVPVLRPGGDEIVGEIVNAAGFEDDPWLGFVPRVEP